MSNQANSRAADLMVGAGVLYFKRTHSNDQHGFHHLGNSTGFSITTEVEKVDKNSSMDKHRELMASVVTSVKPSAKIVLEEYNPYNLALGLFGEECVRKQSAKTLTDEEYTVLGNPSIISLVDEDGNKYFNVKNVKVKPQSTVPATFTAKTTTADMSMATTTVANDTFTDTKGGQLILTAGTFAGTSDVRVFITVKSAPTANGDLNGLELEVKEGLSGAVQTFTVSTTNTSKTFTLTSGAKIEAKVGALQSFTANPAMNEATLTAAMTAYKEGRDFVLSEQELRAGFIKITEGSLIKKGDKVKISAEVPEGTYIAVAGGIAGFIEGELLYIADVNNGPNYNIEGWKVRINPDGEVSGFITDKEFGNFTLSVDFLADREHHPDAPYYLATKVGEASGEENGSGFYDPRY